MTTLTRTWWADNPDFDRFIPALFVQQPRGAGRKSVRIELKPSAPAGLVQLMRAFKAPCVSCGRPIHVFRTRTVAFRGGKVDGGMYLSLVCPSDRPGCSRNRAVDGAYASIAELLRISRPPQGNLLS